MFWLKNIFDILKRIIPRVKIFLNRPNYSFEHNYSYSEDIKKIVTNIEDLISKQLKILKGNYMNFLDSNISFNLRDKYTNIISKIIRNTHAGGCTLLRELKLKSTT
jgi:ribosomal protein S17E